MSKVEKYHHLEIEPRWQNKWDEDGLYHSEVKGDKPKHYALTMLPYPSGDLHIGHWYAMTPADAHARYKRMQGYNVLFPMGFDAFGLPAENAAIKRGIHPFKWTMANVEKMRKQLQSMGAIFDWRREIVSCLPGYYRWTQWFFLKFYEKGMAYRKFSPVDFCPACNTTLAREQVWGEDRHCERCETPVIKKELNQWFFKITDYAEELLDFSRIDWPERVKSMQENWIGRSEGAEVLFHTEAGEEIKIFTTRPDTLWGVTFMVLAPEHPLVKKITAGSCRDSVDQYIQQAGRQTEIERLATNKVKTGVFTGAYAVNPVNDEKIPIWIADYVMMGYGTGAIMAVPAHDERDFDFAKEYHLPVKIVIAPAEWTGGESLSEPLTSVDDGAMINSGHFNGTSAHEGKARVTEWLAQKGIGKKSVNYRLRDWLISRQRYWGVPIPIIYCEKCGAAPVPEKDLPVLLPEDAQFLPTGESPLKYHEGFRHTKCPKCGGPAERETDTMDTFMCSSWYQYGYLSPYHKGEAPFDTKEADYWVPVDLYTGGIEHACMHLIYTRFFTKAMRDLGLVHFDEPMVKLRNQGIILGEDSEKMSKSRGNVVAPDNLVQKYGADAVRVYLMFGWRWEQGGPWDSRGIEGMFRFLNRVWDLTLESMPKATNPEAEKIVMRKTHQTIAKASREIESFSFNTYVSSLMEFTNILAKYKNEVFGTETWTNGVKTLLLLLAPAAPYIAEEIWSKLGFGYSIHNKKWPEFKPELAVEESVEIVLQINGKIRDKISVPINCSKEELREIALQNPTIQGALEGKTIKNVIPIPDRLVNIVI